MKFWPIMDMITLKDFCLIVVNESLSWAPLFVVDLAIDPTTLERVTPCQIYGKNSSHCRSFLGDKTL